MGVGGGTRPTPPSLASGVCERSSSQQSYGWSPERNKIAKNIGELTFEGGFFVNVVSLAYIGMIYINVD